MWARVDYYQLIRVENVGNHTENRFRQPPCTTQLPNLYVNPAAIYQMVTPPVAEQSPIGPFVHQPDWNYLLLGTKMSPCWWCPFCGDPVQTHPTHNPRSVSLEVTWVNVVRAYRESCGVDLWAELDQQGSCKDSSSLDLPWIIVG